MSQVAREREKRSGNMCEMYGGGSGIIDKEKEEKSESLDSDGIEEGILRKSMRCWDIDRGENH
jgi:hypothetical protein